MSHQFRTYNLASMFTTCARHGLPTRQVVGVCLGKFCRDFVRCTVKGRRILRFFGKRLFGSDVQHFHRLGVRCRRLVGGRLCAGLTSGVPSFMLTTTRDSRINVLRGYVHDGKHKVSVHGLFSSVSGLLSHVYPYVLVDPVSMTRCVGIGRSGFSLIMFSRTSRVPAYRTMNTVTHKGRMIIMNSPGRVPPAGFFADGSISRRCVRVRSLRDVLSSYLTLSVPSGCLL